eukprot:1617070-Amphidinium_carterae.1
MIRVRAASTRVLSCKLSRLARLHDRPRLGRYYLGRAAWDASPSATQCARRRASSITSGE